MRYPPRLAHLATRAVLVSRLLPTYAAAHDLDDEEARTRLEAALTPALVERLLTATWAGLLGSTQRLDEAALLEKVAGALADRPHRPGRKATLDPAWSAFLLVVDLEAGTASDMARKVLESAEGQRRAEEGLAAVGVFLAKELVKR